MSDSNITRLVVGERLTLSMGMPVGQTIQETDASKTLRWRNGQWESNTSLLAMAKKATAKRTSVLKIPAAPSRRSMKIYLLSAMALVVVMVLAWAAAVAVTGYMDKQQAAQSLPIGPKITEEPISRAVQSVNEPFPLPPVQQQPEAVTLAPESAPQAPSDVVLPPVNPGVVRPEVQEPRTARLLAVTKPQEKTSKNPEVKDQKTPTSAVVMDAEVQAIKVPATNAPATTAQVQSAKASPNVKAGSGLVALTPDGKFALFTNQKTRLPEKFAVGDKLPSGEVIKSIDKASSRVVTDTKEYRLE